MYPKELSGVKLNLIWSDLWKISSMTSALWSLFITSSLNGEFSIISLLQAISVKRIIKLITHVVLKIADLKKDKA